MGTRVLIICTDGETVSPAVYKHYDGDSGPEIIAAANCVTLGRRVCPNRAAALITAVAINYDLEQARRDDAIHGPSPYRVAPFILSQETDEDVRLAILAAFGRGAAHSRKKLLDLAEEYELDAGLVVVDVRASVWMWQAFAGELERHPQCHLGLGAAA